MFSTTLPSSGNTVDNKESRENNKGNNPNKNSSSKKNQPFIFDDEECAESAVKLSHLDESAADIFPSGNTKIKVNPGPIPADSYKALSAEMKVAVQKLQSETNGDSKRGSAMQNLIKLIPQQSAELKHLSAVLTNILRPSLILYDVPKELNEKDAKESINLAFFLLPENLFKSDGNNLAKDPILQILCLMAVDQPKIGYLLLYYTYVRNTYPSDIEPDKNFSIYKEFCLSRTKKFEDSLINDLQLCQHEHCRIFIWLIPVIYETFPRFAANNDQLLRLVLSNVTPCEVKSLTIKIIRDEIMMFDHDAFSSLISVVLSWESFEQIFFWQLVRAHDISLECMLNSLPKLEFVNDHEALTCIMLLLKCEKPSANYLKPLFCRELKPVTDTLVPTILYYWCTRYTEETAAIVAELLTSRCPITLPNKRKRIEGQGLGSRTGVPPPSAERILGHLDKISHECKEFFSELCIQKALRIAYTACTDTQKQLYSNLFDLLTDEDSDNHSVSTVASTCSNSATSSSTTSNSNVSSSATTGKGRRGRSNAATPSSTASSATNKGGRHATRSSQKEIDLTGYSTEEEEIIKPKINKRRKKIVVVASDSD